MKGRALAVALSALVLLAAGASAAPRAPSTTFLVWPDPRLCPSPLCGGYWLAAANQARTRCHDGLLRPRCYVAEVTTDGSTVTVPPGSLARGTLEAKQYGSIGELGVLAADAVWAPIGRVPASGRFFRLRDLGIRCIRAPCFSVLAIRLNGTARTTVSAVTSETVPAGDRARVEAALGSKAGVLARGRVAAIEGGGRAFLATRYYLPSEG